METYQQQKQRMRYYKLLAVAKRELHMSEEEYRCLLQKHGAKEVDGKCSATTMDLPGLSFAFNEMEDRGFVRLSRGARAERGDTRKDWRKPRIKKITALWCTLSDAGVIRNRSETAMQKYCARITNKAKLEWASGNDLNKCIESLKSMAQRERVKLNA